MKEFYLFHKDERINVKHTLGLFYHLQVRPAKAGWQPRLDQDSVFMKAIVISTGPRLSRLLRQNLLLYKFVILLFALCLSVFHMFISV